MKNHHTYSFIILLCFNCFALEAQEERKILEGNIKSESNETYGVNVQNSTSKKGAITDLYGFFTIPIRLNDTLIFSAVQFKMKVLVVTPLILASKRITIPLEEADNQLDEVVVMPYSLSGNISEDVATLEISPVVTETTLQLPNANAKTYTQAERTLHTARTWDFTGNTIKLDPIVNYFSRRTKMLNKSVTRDAKYKRLDVVTGIVTDSMFINGLHIPKPHIMNFIFFCELDETFDALLVSKENFKIWEFMQKKSLTYLKNNSVETN